MLICKYFRINYGYYGAKSTIFFEKLLSFVAKRCKYAECVYLGEMSLYGCLVFGIIARVKAALFCVKVLY